jgi:hypothetical protein
VVRHFDTQSHLQVTVAHMMFQTAPLGSKSHAGMGTAGAVGSIIKSATKLKVSVPRDGYSLRADCLHADIVHTC